MSTPSPMLPNYSPGLRSLLPLLYVAWADGVLSPSEVHVLRSKIKDLSFLTDADKMQLVKWSRPTHPPSRELFQQWYILIRNHANDGSKSLAELGVNMAKEAANSSDDECWKTPETCAAIEELEAVLGTISKETYRRLFPNLPERAEAIDQSFSIEKMTTLLDSDAPEIKQKMRILLSDPVFHHQVLPTKEEQRAKVLEWTKLLANQGVSSLAFPVIGGGKNDMNAYSAVFEMLGYHDNSLSIKFGVQFGLWGGSIQRLGTEKHHIKYLPKTGTAEYLGCFAMTETGHGSNVRGLETTAVYDQETDELIVHSPNYQAGKEYIGNALHSQFASVFCQLMVKGENHGVHAVVVPLRDVDGNLLPGRKVEDNGYKLGLNGVDNGRIWFDKVRVPRENLLNKFGDIDDNGNYFSPIENPSKRFFTMLGTLVGGRVCVPRAGLSAAKTGLAIAVKWALKRRQFGADHLSAETLLLDYQSHQRRLMPLLAKAYAIDFGLKMLTRKFVAADQAEMREVETLAAGFKSYATWFTTKSLQECREACGGKGYLRENRFADLKADTDIFTTFEGDNTVLMQLAAKGVLSSFNQEINSDGMFSLLRYLGGRVATNVIERNPISVRNTDREHLLGKEFHEEAFAYREDQLKYSVGQRMRRKIKSGMSSYEAYIKCQTHLIALAEAYIERLTLEEFYKVIENEADENVQKALLQLAQLYALHTIESHKGWFLEYDYIESGKSKAIRSMVDELCATVRQDAGALVEAFAIPDSVLGAPIVV